jgi:ferredoxin
MKVRIDADICQGHGRCYELAPEIFSDDDRGRGQVIDQDLGSASLDGAREALSACPEQAILIIE